MPFVASANTNTHTHHTQACKHWGVRRVKPLKYCTVQSPRVKTNINTASNSLPVRVFCYEDKLVISFIQILIWQVICILPADFRVCIRSTLHLNPLSVRQIKKGGVGGRENSKEPLSDTPSYCYYFLCWLLMQKSSPGSWGSECFWVARMTWAASLRSCKRSHCDP